MAANEVNRVPQGVLSLFDMKAQGMLPRFLPLTLAPSVELLPFYLNQVREVRVGQAGPINAAAGWLDASSPIQTQVPSDEIWWVHRVSARATAALNGAGGALLYRILHRTQIGSRTLGIGQPSPVVWGNGDRPDVICDEPFLMNPGDMLGVFVERYTAFAVQPDIGIEALVTRLRV